MRFFRIVTPGTARFFGVLDKRRMDNARAGALGLARDNGRMRMRNMMLAAAAALALAACNQAGSGPQLPPVQPGAQAPSTLTPQTATQQAEITTEVRQQLTANIDSMLDQMQTQSGMGVLTGFTDEIVTMQPGTDHRQLVNLTANSGYTFVGACDGDCTNFDIELIDMSTGGVVASDMLPDDFPIVNFTPSANGQFMIRSIMQACSVAPCFAGARALTAGAAPQAAAGGGGGKP
jgi:hypothetical protein